MSEALSPNNPTNEIALEEKSQRNWAMCSHLGFFLAFLGMTYGGFCVALLIYTFKKDTLFVQKHAKAALNYQITQIIIWSLTGIFMLLTHYKQLMNIDASDMGYEPNFFGFSHLMAGAFVLEVLFLFFAIDSLRNGLRASNGLDPDYKFYFYRFVK